MYPQWIELVSNFTLQSLASDWSWVGESLFYLLSLWSKLITAMPYSKSGKESFLDTYVPKIVEQYVSMRLMAISQQEDDDDEDDVSEHLELMPTMARLDYEKMATFLTSVMDPRLEQYKVFAASGGVGANRHRSLSSSASSLGSLVLWHPSLVAVSARHPTTFKN